MSKDIVTPEWLAGFGEGALAYVREIAAEDLARMFPQAPDVAPGAKVYALLSAAGNPILLADTRDTAIAGAMEQQLRTVTVH